MLVADRIIRLKTVLARAGLSRSTIYRKIVKRRPIGTPDRRPKGTPFRYGFSRGAA